MSTPFSLRKATLEDVPSIAHVFIEARTRCLAFLNWTYDDEIMRSVFTRHLSEMEIWVAESDGWIVGFVGFVPDEVESLYVIPEFHGKGIGSALLQKALSESESEVRLWVFQENLLARAFYERHGFAMEFETDGSDNMEKTPDARYLWRRPSASPAS